MAWYNILAPITNLIPHQKDSTSFTGQGGSYKSGDIATEGIDKSQDSLTQMLRSMSNLTATKGKEALGAGMSDYGKGLSLFDQPEKFWSTLLSGNRDAIADQMAPEASTIVSQYDAGRKAVSEFGARGGGKNSTLAELPTKQAGDIGKLMQGLRPEAAKQLSNIAQVLASLGLSQEQIGTALFSQTIQNLLGRRGQNIAESGQNKELAINSAKLAADTFI
jgi:hypothetical protein